METAQPLHAESKVLVERIIQLSAKPYTELTVEEARTRSKLVGTYEGNAGRIEYDGTRTELFVPLPDFTGLESTLYTISEYLGLVTVDVSELHCMLSVSGNESKRSHSDNTKKMCSRIDMQTYVSRRPWTTPYICTHFGVGSSSRFPFRARTDGQT